MHLGLVAIVVSEYDPGQAPRTEPYGRVAVFADIAGDKWDLLGPAAAAG